MGNFEYLENRRYSDENGVIGKVSSWARPVQAFEHSAFRMKYFTGHTVVQTQMQL